MMCGMFALACPSGRVEVEEIQQPPLTYVHRGLDARRIERERMASWEVWMGQMKLAVSDSSSAEEQPIHDDHDVNFFKGYHSEVCNHRDAASDFTIKSETASCDECEITVQACARLALEQVLPVLSWGDDARQTEVISWHDDEPFSEVSQIPTLAISELARCHAKEVLTGDGGGEAPLGYPWMSLLRRFMQAPCKFASFLDTVARKLMKPPAGKMPTGAHDSALYQVSHSARLPASLSPRDKGLLRRDALAMRGSLSCLPKRGVRFFWAKGPFQDRVSSAARNFPVTQFWRQSNARAT